MKRTIIVYLFISLLFAVQSKKAFAWDNKLTHPAITENAVSESVLAGDYLELQLGLENKLGTKLTLSEDFVADIEERAMDEPALRHWGLNNLSIMDYLKQGSLLEDVPGPRARHHFHDPISNRGLDNLEGPSWIRTRLENGSEKRYPDYWPFITLGASCLDRALENDHEFWNPIYEDMIDWQDEYENKCSLVDARDSFYHAVTINSEEQRENYLGAMFLQLGHVCHLIEDMGVPAHTRNDFILGHMVGGFFNEITGDTDRKLKDGGNPLEIWLEKQIENNKEKIPNELLSMWYKEPPSFSKLADYWDTEQYTGTQYQGDSPGWPGPTSFGNPPSDDWGLAEQTNYQFLSFSTIFKTDGSKQAFPHPAKAHTRVDCVLVGTKNHYFHMGYDIPHLARIHYTQQMAMWYGVPVSYETVTVEDEQVYDDYAKVTLARTIDYTTGLVNYFFRGRLEAWPSVINGDQIEITIINTSYHTDPADVEQRYALKGGEFELYYDYAEGDDVIRAKVTGFTVNGWDSSSILNYYVSASNEITAVFTQPDPPGDAEVIEYILVYKGDINPNSNPNENDDDDPEAIAVCRFECADCTSICESLPACFCATWTDSDDSDSSSATLERISDCCWKGTFDCGEKNGYVVVLTNHCGEWHAWYGGASTDCDYTNDEEEGYTWDLYLDCDGGIVVKTDDSNGDWEQIVFASSDDCYEYTNNCESCYDTNKTPKYMKVTFSGIVDCGSGNCNWVDGDFILTSSNNCVWKNYVSTSSTAVELHLNYSGKVYVQAWRYIAFPPYVYCFFGELTVNSCDDNDSNNNTQGSADCSTWSAAYGGTATWSIYPGN